jgi:hypothetical protein
MLFTKTSTALSKAEFQQRSYGVTAPFYQTVARVGARPDGYDIQYQAESHVEALTDFQNACRKFMKYPNFQPLAIVNPSESGQEGVSPTIKIFEGKDAAKLASKWDVGQKEEY